MTASTWLIAGCIRRRHLALAVFCRGEVIEFRRHFLGRRGEGHQPCVRRLLALAAEYGATVFVVEPKSSLARALRERGRRVRTLAVSEAANRLLPQLQPRTLQHLLDYLVNAYPQLQRFVTLSSGTSQVSMTERRETMLLLPVALGLAALLKCERHHH